MIVFDLACAEGHRFEGWFADSGAFADQRERGLIECPVCSSASVDRSLSAPRIAGTRSNASPSPRDLLQQVVALQATMLPKSKWVGRAFATEARAMAEGETAPATIHGQATPEEAKSLHDEGIAVMPLLVPVVPPEERN